jgi:predicted nucleic acid-binding protein
LGSITYLDTNIFIKAFEGRDERSRALLDLFSQEPPFGFIPFATSELTLAELLVNPYRRNDDVGDLERMHYETLVQPSEWLVVVPVDREVLAGAALLRSLHPIKLPDAIHISSALKLGCTHLMTDDRGIRGSYALKYTSPTQNWQSSPISVMRPSVAEIAALPASWQQS